MDTAKIDGLLEGAVAAGQVPGVIAVAGDREGVIYEGAFGSLSIDGGGPARPDTTIRIASMTKAITSVAALQLIERGSLELEQPVSDVLPAFGELQVLEGWDGEKPSLRAPTRQATIRQLLTHTSGLSYWFSNPDVLRYHRVTGLPDPLTGLRAMFDAPLVSDPGTRWEYGTNTDWLGLVIEAVSGQDLGGYCREHIFDPLGMPDATFRPSDEQYDRMMALHAREQDGTLALSTLEIPLDPEFDSGGGGAVATAPDYVRFTRALLRGGELDGERVLRPDTVELLFTDHLDGLALPKVQPSAIPELSHEVPALPFRQGFGLGLHLLFEDIPGMRRAGTGDWAGLFNCYYWIDRTTGVTGVFLTQVLPFFDAQIVEISVGFEAALYAELLAPAAA